MVAPLPHWSSHDVAALRPFSRIRLVALDLDGTAVESNSEEAWTILRQFCVQLRHYRYGVSVTVATGRTFHGAAGLAASLGVPDGVPMVLYNGAVVLSQGTRQVSQATRVSARAFDNLVRGTLNAGLVTLAYYLTVPFAGAPLGGEHVVGFAPQLLPPREEVNGLRIRWTTAPPSDLEASPPIAVLVEVASTEERAIAAQLASAAGLGVTNSGGRFVEVRAPGVNKAVGLGIAASAMRIAPSEVLALGDNDNDAEMLSWAGLSVAVGGASELARSASQYVCRYGPAQGAVEVLRLIRAARRYYYRSGVQDAD